MGLRTCRGSSSAVIPAEDTSICVTTETEQTRSHVEETALNSPPPPGVHPSLVPVILVRVIQQLVVALYDPLSLPAARGAPCRQHILVTMETCEDIRRKVHAHLARPLPPSLSQSTPHRTAGCWQVNCCHPQFLLKNKAIKPSYWGPVRTTTALWRSNCSLPVAGDPQVPSRVLMVELSSASISFSKSSPLEDSLSPVRYSLISFFFCSTVPFSSTSSSSSELNHSKGHHPSKTPTRNR